MPQIQLIAKYSKNTGLTLSPSEIRRLYFFGVEIRDKAVNELPDSTIEFNIRAAQREIENELKLKFTKQLFNDNMSYHRDMYRNGLPIIKTRYPVNEPLSLTGFYKKVEQINYPQTWLSAHQNDDGVYLKKVNIVPTAGSSVGTSQDVILTGITTSYYGSLGRYETLPNYWELQYVTGYDSENYPYDLINVVGMLAAIPIFAIAGDLILGAGIASMSLGIDGLSQSISSTSSATNSGYGSRIIEYRKSIASSMKKIKSIYKGISFDVL
ncbi:MAG: hypothetical protein OEL54_03680 [Flavobacteriaceae bacterium]|nr:hypothetical protein [Flavobacteriaceae bacterium]